LSPDLKIGMTFKILSCTGTIPVFKEREITCLRGGAKGKSMF
jgi:hypothetical protein